jgi:SAM-dependent methyltransferase
MPGTRGTFAAARAAIEGAGIGHVVCLAGAEEIHAVSPDYAAALARGVPWSSIDFPIPDLGAPADRPAFCGLAVRVADLLREGETVLIHCRAGVGRTGLLAVAALMALGESPAAAAAAVAAAGSAPETAVQAELLEWIAASSRRVAGAYDRLAARWSAARVAGARAHWRERPWLDGLAASLPPGARVLDLGCGAGAPIAVHLAERGFRVTGLDASARMLELARQTVPGATLVHGDMRSADPGGPFDGIVAWDSVFHLPREDQTALLGRLAAWLRPGGRLLLSLGGSEGEFTAEMLGEAIYFAAHAPATALALLRSAGFTIDRWEIDDPTSRAHLALLATRRGVS